MTKTHKNVPSPKHKKMFWVLLLISDWQWWHCRLLAHLCTPCTKQQKCINPLPARDCAPLEQFNFSNDLQGRTSKSETFILQTLFHSKNSLTVRIYAGHVMSSSQTGKDFAKSMNIICDILMARNGSIQKHFPCIAQGKVFYKHDLYPCKTSTLQSKTTMCVCGGGDEY